LTLYFQKLSHQTFGGLRTTAALHQHIENEAILIDGPPQPDAMTFSPLKLVGSGKRITVAITAIARELVGFLWDVARRSEGETASPTA
jgi:hypothetical protein